MTLPLPTWLELIERTSKSSYFFFPHCYKNLMFVVFRLKQKQISHSVYYLFLLKNIFAPKALQY